MRHQSPESHSIGTAAGETAGLVHDVAIPITGVPSDFDALMQRVGDARYVLLGEASHGTHEFYQTRCEITKRLIVEHGFDAVAVEADWPDANRVNNWVRNVGTDTSAESALEDFERFPEWMWRNSDVLDFVVWLREHNHALRSDAKKIGFYGLDLYSLHTSIAAVLAYLDATDEGAAARARKRYSCFDHFDEEPERYGRYTTLGIAPSCEREVIAQLVELRASAAEVMRRGDHFAADAHFFAEQNARLVRNAEQYYRSMFMEGERSWNLRDQHMAETLWALTDFQRSQGRNARVVVWAHNSHLGDARATAMTRRGELNVGQLVRERVGADSVLVGFSTYSGRVTAASDWDAPAERKIVRPALPDSYEALLHQVPHGNFYLDLNADNAAVHALMQPRMERAIGVIYRPETERMSHYFQARLPQQFDALFHFDTTRAVQPLTPTERWERGEVAETYPTGL